MTQKKKQTPTQPLFEIKDLLLFSKIVQERSYTQVALSEGIPKSSLSRRISELEERTGARLFNRTTRSLEVTDLGETLYRKAQAILAAVGEAEEVVQQKKKAPGGLLRIQTPIDYALPVIQPLIQEFSDAHPEYRFEISTAPLRNKTEASQFDFMVHPNEISSDLAAGIDLPAFEWELVASPIYLEHESTPESPADLPKHRLITNGSLATLNRWTLTNHHDAETVSFSPWLKSSNLLLMKMTCAAGYGIALVPSYLVEEEVMIGTLVRVLPEWRMNESRMVLAYARHREKDPKLQLFLEFISGKMTPGRSAA